MSVVAGRRGLTPQGNAPKLGDVAWRSTLLSPMDSARAKIASGRGLAQIDESLKRSGVGAGERRAVIAAIADEYWEQVLYRAKTQLARGLPSVVLALVAWWLFAHGAMRPRGAIGTGVAATYGVWQTTGGILDLIKYNRRGQ